MSHALWVTAALALAAWWLHALLVSAAGLIAGRAVGSRAAVASVTYRVALAVVLAMPLLTVPLALVPGWSLPLAALTTAPRTIESPRPELPPPAGDVAAVPSVSRGVADAERAALPSGSDSFAFEGQPPAHFPEPGFPQTGSIPASGELTLALASPALSGDRHEAAATEFSLTEWGAVAVGLVAVWLAGTFVLLIRLAQSALSLRRLTQQAVPAAESEQALADRLASEFGARAVPVRRSPLVPSPCLAGMLRPTILLPDAETLASSELRDVLAHELAHVRRRDLAWTWVRELAIACLWPQPMVWWLARRLEQSAEDVCDDLVLAGGGNRGVYAGQLLSLADSAAIPPLAVGCGIVSLKSALRHRVERIVDRDRTLSTRAGRVAIAGSLVVALLTATTVGLIRLEPAAAAEEPAAESLESPETSETSETTADPASERDAAEDDRRDVAANETDAGNTDAGNTDVGKTSAGEFAAVPIFGRVITPEGRPLVGQTVRVVYSTADDETNVWTTLDDLEQTTTTDETGRFELALSPEAQRLSMTPSTTKSRLQKVALSLESDELLGEHTVFNSWVTVSLAQIVTNTMPVEGYTLTAFTKSVYEGRVLSEDGRPLPGVRVRVKQRDRFTAENFETLRTGLRGSGNEWRLRQDLHEQRTNGYGSPNLLGVATTDETGRFTLPTTTFEVMQLYIDGPEVAWARERMAWSDEESIRAHTGPEGSDDLALIHGQNEPFVVAQPRPIAGQVRLEDGTPVVDAEVEVYTQNNWNQPYSIQLQDDPVRTDGQGRYELANVAATDDLELRFRPRPESGVLPLVEKVPLGDGVSPVTIDTTLKQGVVVSGRLVDPAGNPIEERMRVLHFPTLANEYASDSGLYDDYSGPYDQDDIVTDAEGRFVISVVPGDALLATSPSRGNMPYKLGHGFENTDDLAGGRMGMLKTFSVDLPADRSWLLSAVRVNVPADAERFEQNLELAPSNEFHIDVLRADGTLPRRLRESQRFYAYGLRRLVGNRVYASPGDADRPDPVIVEDDDGQVAVLRHTLKTDGQTVRLAEPARITGRLLDRFGEPVVGLSLSFDAIGGSHAFVRYELNQTDAEGRFDIEGIPPGTTWSLVSMTPGEGGNFGKFLLIMDERELAPGELVELGDVTVEEARQRSMERSRMKREMEAKAMEAKAMDAKGMKAESNATERGDDGDSQPNEPVELDVETEATSS